MLQIECTSLVKPSHPSCTELLGTNLDFQKVCIRPLRYCIHTPQIKKKHNISSIRVAVHVFVLQLQVERNYTEVTAMKQQWMISQQIFLV